MEDDSFEAKTSAFRIWLSEIGITLSPKIELADYRLHGRGRGVVALQSFEEDEIIFSIPRSAILNISTAGNDNPITSEDAVDNLPQWLRLTYIVLAESMSFNSKWMPYLSILPADLDSLVFWEQSELSELQASTVITKIGKAAAEDMFLKYLAPLDLDGFSLSKCHKIASIIMAYAFDIPENPPDEIVTEDGDDLVSDDENDTILSLIPLADILNADADKNNARLCCDNDEVLEMRAIKPISPGEEILNDYGSLPQSDLLRRYGYVSDYYAKYNVVEIPTILILDCLKTTLLEPLRHEDLQQRMEVASREDIYDDSYDLSHSGPDGPGIPTPIIAFLYLMLMSDSCFKDIQTSKDNLPSRSKLSTEMVGYHLVHIFKFREQQYATTLSEDEELLKKGNLSTRLVLAIKVRLGEKKVLQEAIKEAKMFNASNSKMRPKNRQDSENSIEVVAPAKRRRLK